MNERITGSEALCRALIAEGVDTIFGYPGGQIMPFYDTLYDHTDKLHHILTRHEQGAIRTGFRTGRSGHSDFRPRRHKCNHRTERRQC